MSPFNEDLSNGAGPAVITIEGRDWNDASRHKFSFKRLLQFMGPGILMSIAYVDPGNLESDLQVGAQAGYVLLWLLLLSTFMGLVVQMQAAKLGVVTGKHLAQHCRQQYPPVPRIALWLMAEVAIIGSDIQEVIGSAIALAILSGGRLPLWGGVLLTAADSFALLFIEKLGIRVLEGFFGVMVGIMVVAFGVMYGRADVPSGEVLRGFVLPQLPKKDIPVAVALMGSLIMPHNIYLHSALVQTRKLGSSHPAAKREALTYFGIESALSLVVAVVINLFITAVFAAGFYGAELPDIGLQNAGKYLGETYGQPVVYIWALGLLAAGQSSTMTGTYTGQFVMGGYLDLQVSPWARVALTRAVAIAPTLVVALMCSGNGNGNQLDQLNQGLNLLQSIQLPFALVPVLTFTSSPAIMGSFANSPLTSSLCWAIAALVVLINGLAVYEVAYEAVVADPWVTGTALVILSAIYLAMVAFLVLGPQSQLGRWLGWDWGRRWTCCKCGAKAAAAVGVEGEGVEEPLLGAEAGREEEAGAGAGAGVCVRVRAVYRCCARCRCGQGAKEEEEEEKAVGAAEEEGKGVGEEGKGAGAVVVAPPAVCTCARWQREGERERRWSGGVVVGPRAGAGRGEGDVEAAASAAAAEGEGEVVGEVGEAQAPAPQGPSEEAEAEGEAVPVADAADCHGGLLVLSTAAAWEAAAAAAADDEEEDSEGAAGGSAGGAAAGSHPPAASGGNGRQQ
ncbi:hypothetical protein PLESTB_001736900 [Pleodorina starrii]|uniref:Uncharacterized protein n=1 Tax=Pleodorina starrii TaxID=330485 RepID=A0A9W6F9Z5_9CHLO|nr:hypothetical protein PLESTM_000745100 [Pleodorina starrii]GLC61260.1 hypothetical protein PLESTB_001736900 [Pleodorina starrii]GLC74734.1 hypothetical protein PLESTF_001549700 [Pleodorina starrii]